MRPCLTQHPGPVLAFVVVLHLADSTEKESAPMLDYGAAEALGQLRLHDAGVVGFTVKSKLVERGPA